MPASPGVRRGSRGASRQSRETPDDEKDLHMSQARRALCGARFRDRSRHSGFMPAAVRPVGRARAPVAAGAVGERGPCRRRLARAGLLAASQATAASSPYGDADFHGSTGAVHAEPADRRHGRDADPATATGWSPPTAASSRSATPQFYGSTGAIHAEPADRRHGRHADRQRLLARRLRRRHLLLR